MSRDEEETRRYLDLKADQERFAHPRLVPQRKPRPSSAQQEASFTDFVASQLFCPKCQRVVPVREKLVLYLPGGELYECLCTVCGTSLGKRQTQG